MFYTALFPQKTPGKDIYKYHQTAYMSMKNYLIKSGANVNLNDGCKTPLTTACEKGQLEIVQELIKCGANVNLRDTYETPLELFEYSKDVDRSRC